MGEVRTWHLVKNAEDPLCLFAGLFPFPGIRCDRDGLGSLGMT